MHVTPSSLRRWASTIKFKIVLMVVSTCVLSAAGTAGLVLATSQQHMATLLRNRAADDRERTAALLTSKVNLLKEALSAVAQGTPAALWSSPAAMADLLQARPVLNVLFTSVFAAAPDGRMLARIDKGQLTTELPHIAAEIELAPSHRRKLKCHDTHNSLINLRDWYQGFSFRESRSARQPHLVESSARRILMP